MRKCDKTKVTDLRKVSRVISGSTLPEGIEYSLPFTNIKSFEDSQGAFSALEDAPAPSAAAAGGAMSNLFFSEIKLSPHKGLLSVLRL